VTEDIVEINLSLTAAAISNEHRADLEPEWCLILRRFDYLGQLLIKEKETAVLTVRFALSKNIPKGGTAEPQISPLRRALSKNNLLPSHKGSGAPSFALLAKGGTPLLFTPRPLPATSAYPTLRGKREGWGTRSFVRGQEILAATISLSPWVFHHLGWAAGS
jgi:hypothetical protein